MNAVYLVEKYEEKSFSRILLDFLMGVIAMYISWECNTLRGITILPKLAYALFAFAFAPVYIIYYLMFNYGDCK